MNVTFQKVSSLMPGKYPFRLSWSFYFLFRYLRFSLAVAFVTRYFFHLFATGAFILSTAKSIPFIICWSELQVVHIAISSEYNNNIAEWNTV